MAQSIAPLRGYPQFLLKALLITPGQFAQVVERASNLPHAARHIARNEKARPGVSHERAFGIPPMRHRIKVCSIRTGP
jgi:hypothetical protein